MNLVPLTVIRQSPRTVLLGCMTVIPASTLPGARAKTESPTTDTTVTVAATTTNDDDRNSKSTYNCSDRIAGWAGLPG